MSRSILHRLGLAAVAAWAAGAAPAQGMGGRGLDGQRALPPGELRLELERQKQRLLSAHAEKDRLMVLLSHAALGHDVTDSVAVLIERVLDSAEQDRERARLDELRKELVRLNGEYAQWRSRADSELAQVEAPGEPFPVGDAPLVPVGAAESLPAAPGDVLRPAAPGPETAPVTTTDGVPTDEDAPAVFGLVKGSTDHGAVGRLLFLSGRALSQRARRASAEGDVEAAAEYRASARVKFRQGLRELRQVLYVDPDEGAEYRANAEYTDLFHEARCLLGMFDVDADEGTVGFAVDVRVYEQRMEAIRRPLLEITARDQRTENGTQVRGRWSGSAETLLDQLRWRMAQDGYEPPVADLSWREEK